jgi:predicted lipid-binding transport protein (Tim44 family)
MPRTEYYIERADSLAQEVVNAWGTNSHSGNSELLTDDFMALLDKACTYRHSKRLADNHREIKVQNGRDAAELEEARREFAEAYNIFSEDRQAAV